MNKLIDLFSEIQIEKIETKSLDKYIKSQDLEKLESSIYRVYEITNKYRNINTIDLNVIGASNDLLELQAIHVYISTHLGYFQAISANAEHIRKLSESKAAVAIRDKIEDINKSRGVPIKLSESTIDDISKVLIQDQILMARDNEISSRMLTNVSYAITDFTKVLNSILNRETQERKNNRE